jgi:hypothetical protein
LRRLAAVTLLLAWALVGTAEATKLRISNRYSPLNRVRDAREQTDYIILHTTEGNGGPSLQRVRQSGLAHYIVMLDGRVHRVIKRQLVARHAGRSMWDGRENLDQHSIGIEVVGYHNKPLRDVQITALAELIRQLQGIYDIPDDRVITHSMVAYGLPNRWHHHAHRGRKRCGMQFAQPDLRARLGLHARPLRDPDVLAGRLVEADPYLAMVLYAPEEQSDAVVAAEFSGPDNNVITATRTAWFIARDQFDAPSTVYVLPSGRRVRGNEITDWSRMAAGTRVLLDQEDPTTLSPASPYLTLGPSEAASLVAGSAYDQDTTVYVRPDGRILRGDLMSERDFRRLPPGTRVFLGFQYAGKVTNRHTAYELCGPRYREDTTLYLLPGGRVKNGQEIREERIPGGTHVLLRS